ncbi:hypothetical protein PPYR_03388 [Photinus pyralis]|uniref:AMP-dependent synthetase/ligase domain-containing protein n=1 Tax=Photinus pyralis TaxID=7054 RepID=A0A5N4A2T0_PHOPY|nr:4-coumarate--CoA ligase 1-like [Photinus pyralis]KAB0791588.1 hypothetical protein PPYR_03388 [Photinus pyralis]
MSGLQDSSDDDRIVRMPDLDYTPDPRGLGFVLHASMKKHLDTIAQIDGVTGETDTYRSLLQKCTRVAHRMRAMGVTDEDVVTIYTHNHLNACVPYLAGMFLGAKVSGLDPSLSVTDTAHLLRLANPKLAFVAPELRTPFRESLARSGSDTKVITFGPDFDELLAPIEDEDRFRPYEAKDLKETCIIFFSSGTSGLPKCICTHHYGFMCQWKLFLDCGFVQDVYFVFSSLYWVSVASCICSVVLGGKTRLFIPRFSVEAVWNAIDKYKPTLIAAVPFHLVSVSNARPIDVDTSSLVHILVGGAALIESQLKTIRKAFPDSELYTGYGQTEMAVTITVFKPNSPRDRELIRKKPTSCGTGCPGISYKIVDLQTQELLGPNQQGELRLKTKFHLSGYYKMDSSHLLDEDGWYKTGDVVYYDDDRCFYVVDRLSEFLKFRGFHVPPAWIEDVLAAHPQIAGSLVIGLPHDLDENHLMALVVLKDRAANVEAKEIERYVEERVDDRKRLRGGVKIVDAIPLSDAGKMRRREIRNMVLRGEL